MIATAFDEDNGVLGPGDGVSPDEVAALSVHRGVLDSGEPVLISCFKVTPAELTEIQKTGRVWLVVRGTRMMPVILSGISPFDERF